MKDKKLKKQYDEFSEEFSEICHKLNKESREVLYKILGVKIKGKKLLDLACGDGRDMKYYAQRGAEIHGLDMSEDFITMAKKRNPKHEHKIIVSDFEDVKFPNKKFDIVVSKYAIQTSNNIKKVFDEVYRVLRPKGEFILLVTHPLRQFLERKGKIKNYFKPKVVDSILFGGKITVKEPAHTFYEYMSPEILTKFDLQLFDEKCDSKSIEQINGDTYPGFMILKFRKR